MQVLISEAPKVRKDYTVRSTLLPFPVELSGGVRNVKSGTPLAPTDDGWVLESDPYKVVGFASEARSGGETTHAALAMVVDTHVVKFKAGNRLAITDIDDYGNIELTVDDDGPHIALGKSLVLLSAL